MDLISFDSSLNFFAAGVSLVAKSRIVSITALRSKLLGYAPANSMQNCKPSMAPCSVGMAAFVPSVGLGV